MQWVNFLVLFFVARYQFIPATTVGVLIVFGIILYEGLLGGGTYVNAFYRITKEVKLIVYYLCPCVGTVL